MWLAILSGILLAFAYPVFNLEFLAFVAFVPLFFAIKNKNFKQAFFLAYITGIIFWAITIYWLIHVTLLGLILLVLYLALYFGLFGVFFRLNTKYPVLNTITLPAAWIFLEYLRSTLITGFPWALLGYSQYLNLPFIQIADITGVWGVSFLVMLVNVMIYQVIASAIGGPANLCGGHRSWVIGKKQKNVLIVSYLFTILCTLIILAYGYFKIYLSPKSYELRPIKIALIQGSIPQYQKWDENFKNSILERYENLTKEAARDKPDLIIWPETSVPGVVNEEPELLPRILELAKDVNVPLLIGAVTAKSITDYRLPITNYYNSAILISPDGKIIQQYDKLHLVPFGEYVPLERNFPFLRGLIGVPIGDFTPGQDYTVFYLPLTTYDLPLTFSTMICFEDILPGLSRRFVKEGAQFLVNITNDAWFMESTAPYQHVQASVFRAVENRVPVVRAANTGVSCFIDRYGRIYDKVSDGKKDIFVVGYRVDEVVIKNEK